MAFTQAEQYKFYDNKKAKIFIEKKEREVKR